MKGLARVRRGFIGVVAACGGVQAQATAAYAQQATTELPSLVVEAEGKKKPQKQKKNSPAPISASQPEPQLPVSDSAPTESATGPVNGIVAKRSATGTKTDTPIVEIPQTVNVVTKDEIEVRGAQTVSQALRYTPGILVEEEGGTETRRDTIYARGFIAPQFLDGLAVVGTPFQLGVGQVEPYGLERVEVFKGPASALFGSSSPGGLVNMVTKRPTDESIREVSLQVGSFDRLQGAFDLSGRSNESGTVLFRLTGLFQDSETQVDFTDDNRIYIAPALTFKPSDLTTLTVLANYQHDEKSPFSQAPLYGTYLPHGSGRSLPVSRNYGEPGFEHYYKDMYSVGYILDHRFSPGFSFHQALRYSRVDEDSAIVGSSGMFFDFLDYIDDPNKLTLDRNASVYVGTTEGFTVDNSLQFQFATGVARHRTLAGIDYSWSSLVDAFGVNYPPTDPYDPGDVPPIDIFNPVYGSPFTRPTLGPTSSNTQEQLGIYLQDEISLDRWRLTLSGRYDWAPTSVKTPYESYDKTDEAFTGRAGLSYVFDNGVVPYASYSESFQPVAGLDRLGNVFDPTTGAQYEAGIKYEPRWIPALFSAAIFDITQQNVLTADLDDPFMYYQVQTGEVRVRGFEVEGKAEIVRGFDVFGGYSFLDAEITKSNTPGELGNRFNKIPRHQASLGFNYVFQEGSVASGFGFGGGVRYIGDRYSDNANAFPIDEVTLFDTSVSYDFGALSRSMEGVTLQVNATNIFDEEYISQAGMYGAIWGNSRTVLAKMKYAW